jgi:glycosyltransferase involved in cell wall biosynthesis
VKILMLCEYVRQTPWSGSAWATHLAPGLAGLGHDVVVACDGLDDPALVAPAQVLCRDRARRAEHRRPSHFASWARRLVRDGPQDASLSLSPCVGADVWCPVEPAAGMYVDQVLQRRNPASLAMAMTHMTWLPGALLAERRALATRAAPSPIGVSPHDGGMGYASAFDAPGAREREDVRRSVRALLGVSQDRQLLVMSGVHQSRGGLSAMLEGLAGVGASRETMAPILLVMGREGYSVHAIARRQGCERQIRLLGGTNAAHDAIAGADAALAPIPATDRQASGRFIADCLRLGVPVVADADAPGAALLSPTTFGTAPVGLIVEGADPARWARAIDQILSREWLEPSRRAAADVGATLSMDALLRRIERALDDASGRRRTVFQR